MPSNDAAPTFAILTEVDARAWAGNILNMSAGGNVALPTQDYWEDALNLLNGRCSAATHDLDARVKVIKGGTWSIYLNVEDRVVIEDTAGAWTLKAGYGREAYGFPAAGDIASVLVAGTNRVTATLEWVRGNVENAHLGLDDGVLGFVPDVAFRSQDVITMLRSTTDADADGDDRTANLEAKMNAAYGATQGYRWGINATGHAWVAVDKAAPVALDSSGFLNADFQRWLGFKGDEATQFTVSPITGAPQLSFIEGTYPCMGAIVPTRPVRRITARVDETSHTARLTSGELANSKVMDWRSWVVEWWLDGPADQRDLSTHWFDLIERAPKGARWALYQVWGDPRRARYTADVRTDVAGAVEAYDILGTAELDGYRGRIRARRGAGDTSLKANAWPSALRRRIPMTTILEASE